MGRKLKEENYEEELKRCFAQWVHYKENGGSDPFWEDGCNMNLIRNHIFNYKGKIAEKYGDNEELYPEIYFKETPPEVSQQYMARGDEIRANAIDSYDRYMTDENLQYLMEKRDLLDNKDRKQLSVDNVIRYAYGLQCAIQEDNLLVMRRHERSGIYLEAFAECAEKVKKILQKEPEVGEQINMFTFLNQSR